MIYCLFLSLNVTLKNKILTNIFYNSVWVRKINLSLNSYENYCIYVTGLWIMNPDGGYRHCLGCP